MQIVIDIDSYVLEHCKRHVKEHYANNIEEAIANGVLLPKGHGRLIDADAIEGHPRYDCEGFEVGKDFDWMDIEDAPTIIEADKDE